MVRMAKQQVLSYELVQHPGLLEHLLTLTRSIENRPHDKLLEPLFHIESQERPEPIYLDRRIPKIIRSIFGRRMAKVSSCWCGRRRTPSIQRSSKPSDQADHGQRAVPVWRPTRVQTLRFISAFTAFALTPKRVRGFLTTAIKRRFIATARGPTADDEGVDQRQRITRPRRGLQETCR